MRVVKVVESESRGDFEFEITKIIERAKEPPQIHFAATPDIHSGSFGGSYSSGSVYYALVIYEI